jgi:hypothetical protein
MKLRDKNPKAFAKIFEDEHERQRAILATRNSNTIEQITNPRLDQLEAKRTMGSQSIKRSNTNTRTWVSRVKQKKGKTDGENQLLDQGLVAQCCFIHPQ